MTNQGEARKRLKALCEWPHKKIHTFRPSALHPNVGVEMSKEACDSRLYLTNPWPRHVSSKCSLPWGWEGGKRRASLEYGTEGVWLIALSLTEWNWECFDNKCDRKPMLSSQFWLRVLLSGTKSSSAEPCWWQTLDKGTSSVFISQWVETPH